MHLRTGLWPDLPVVFGVIDKGAEALKNLPPNVTGTTIRLTLRNSVMAAKALVPGLKRIALVGDLLERQTYRRHFRQELPVFAGDLGLIDLTGLPMSEIRKRVAVLPENTAIIYTAISVDGAGMGYVPRDALALVAEVANRPIVVDVETYLGYGGTGGLVVHPVPAGQTMAWLALRILNGESPAKIPVAVGDLACKFWQGRSAGANHSQNQPRDSGGDDRHDASARELFHEQISTIGPY